MKKQFILKAFEADNIQQFDNEITLDLIWGDNMTESLTFTKKEIAEKLDYQHDDKGLVSEFYDQHLEEMKTQHTTWDFVEFDLDEIDQFLIEKDLLYTKDERQLMVKLEYALQAHYEWHSDCFELIGAKQIKELAEKFNLTIN